MTIVNAIEKAAVSPVHTHIDSSDTVFESHRGDKGCKIFRLAHKCSVGVSHNNRSRRTNEATGIEFETNIMAGKCRADEGKKKKQRRSHSVAIELLLKKKVK